MVDESLLHILPDANIANIRRKFLDISYGTQSEFEKLDIYLPTEGEGPFPTIIFIHGGAWYACDKRDTQIEPYLTLLPEGYALASINYRLSDEANYPAGVFDCKAAVRFLKAHAGEYQLDAGRIALAGQSAGAYYVLMLGSTIGDPDMEDLSMGWADQDTEVRCMVSWYAPTDIDTMYEQLRKNGKAALSHSDPTTPEARYLGGQLDGLPPELVRKASPLYHVHPGMPPMLLQHGREDQLVPWQQSQTFYDRAKALGNDVTLELFENAQHADPAFETPENMVRVKQFLDEHMR